MDADRSNYIRSLIRFQCLRAVHAKTECEFVCSPSLYLSLSPTLFLSLSLCLCVFVVFAFNSNQVRFVSTSRDDILSADATGCDPSDRYAIIVHGWSESCGTSWAEELRKSELHFRTSRIRPHKICRYMVHSCKEHFCNERKAPARRRKSIVSCVWQTIFEKN